MLGGGRLKLFLLGSLCVGFGWWSTRSLTPGGEGRVELEGGRGEVEGMYEGVLKEGRVEGILVDEEEDGDVGEEVEVGDKPSVKGALADLHHAVSDKLHSWNPYLNPPLPVPAHGVNRTKIAAANDTASPPLLSGETIHEGLPEDSRLGARVRIGKCTILFNGNSYWERAIRTHEVHDRLHNYRLHVLRQEILDDVWSKPAYILSLLLRELSKPPPERLEWLLWVDSDMVLLNPYIPIETFLPPPGPEFEDVNLMYAKRLERAEQWRFSSARGSVEREPLCGYCGL